MPLAEGKSDTKLSAGWLDHVKTPSEELVADVCHQTIAAFRAMINKRLPVSLKAVRELLLDEVTPRHALEHHV